MIQYFIATFFLILNNNLLLFITMILMCFYCNKFIIYSNIFLSIVSNHFLIVEVTFKCLYYGIIYKNIIIYHNQCAKINNKYINVNKFKCPVHRFFQSEQYMHKYVKNE